VNLKAIRRCELCREDVDELARYAYKTALQILGNHEAAEDAIAEAFKAFVKLSPFTLQRFEDEQHVLRFFGRMVKFKASDEIKRRSRQVPIDHYDLPEDVPGAVLPIRSRELRAALGLPPGAGLNDVIRALIEGADLEGLEPEVLQAHIVEGVSAAAFAARQHLRDEGQVEVIKDRMLRKIRRLLGLGRNANFWIWRFD
jgi:DNA-directed RNA polymerase specialized sigma24 family protein